MMVLTTMIDRRAEICRWRAKEAEHHAARLDLSHADRAAWRNIAASWRALEAWRFIAAAIIQAAENTVH